MKANSLFPLKLPMIKGRPSIPASAAKGAKPEQLKKMKYEAELALRCMARADSFVQNILKQDGRQGDVDLASPNVVLVEQPLREPGPHNRTIGVNAVAITEKGHLEVEYKTREDNLTYKKDGSGSTYQNFAYPREYHVSKNGKTLTILDQIQ